ncbi:MAG: hypothetical protein RH862_08625 [Leptospiraceae bacterium]
MQCIEPFTNMRAFWQSSTLLALVCILLLAGCEGATDSIRNWGMRERGERILDLSEEDLNRLKRDLKLSEERAVEFEKNLKGLLQEQSLQGDLAWKIGKAIMQQGRYEAADPYFRQSVDEDSGPVLAAQSNNYFEEALPYYRKALTYNKANPELLFEAGLCYANASRALGWERTRFESAEFLFEAVARLEPGDHRPRYQLALLYGKSEGYGRNPQKALEILDEILRKEEKNIPVRFAKANVLVENGNLRSGADEYRRIIETMDDLYERGVLRGDRKRNVQYRSARENLEKLETCLQGKPGCEIITEETIQP